MTLTQNRPHAHGGGPTGSPPERFTSRNPDDFAIPRGREEEWRFTPLRDIRALFEPFTPVRATTETVTAPEGVTWRVARAEDPAIGRVIRPSDRVSALAFRHSTGALIVSIAPGVTPSEPVVVDVTGTGGLSYGHIVIEAGANSDATVIIEHRGSVTVAANVEVIVGDGARLSYVSVQDWASDTIHLATHQACIGRDATLKHIVVNLGGRLIRLVPSVRFDGPGGSAELLGVSFAGDGQHFESRLYVDHSGPNCTSNVLYKNALLGDSARTVWIGDVRIRPEATGTSTFEMNRNLLLSEGARADSVPTLEIETGDIAGAGHASTTGRFDDLQLFYLQSRGIDKEHAQRLVVRGFFADAVHRMGIPDLERKIMTRIETRLGFAPGSGDEESTDA